MDLPLYAVVAGVMLVAALAGLVGWLLAERSATGPVAGPGMDEALAALRSERAQFLNAALDVSLSVASSKLGDQLSVGKHVIDRERLAVADQVGAMSAELRRLGETVTVLQKERAEQNGALAAGLRSTATVTAELAQTTAALKEALASPKSRGQWGERMAADVLRAAGFVEGVNYARQVRLASGGVPDYSFSLPKGQMVHMDVKFPASAYLRWLEADNDAEAETHVRQFRSDVRARVNELVERGYTTGADSVDYVLVFIPNESIFGFVHEHDPDLVDYALERRVVLTSPTSLFAVLAVVRSAVENFLIEQKSDELLARLGSLADQWAKVEGSIDKMGRGLANAQAAFDDLSGPRRRAMGRSLDLIAELREAEVDVTAEPASLRLDLSVAEASLEAEDGSLESTGAEGPAG